MSNLFYVNSYPVSYSDLPLPPTPSTKMWAHAPVFQGSIYRILIKPFYIISTMEYTSQAPKTLEDLYVILQSIHWSNYPNHCTYHHHGTNRYLFMCNTSHITS